MAEQQPRPSFVGEDGKYDYNAYRRWRYHNDPVYRAKIIESSLKTKQKKLANDPEYHKKCKQEWLQYNLERYRVDTEYKQKKQEYGRKYYHDQKDQKEALKKLQTLFIDSDQTK
jgi:hypothetical protein